MDPAIAVASLAGAATVITAIIKFIPSRQSPLNGTYMRRDVCEQIRLNQNHQLKTISSAVQRIEEKLDQHILASGGLG